MVHDHGNFPGYDPFSSHRYNLRGRSKKDRLALSFGEALTRAERDIKQNWSVYRERFLKGEWP